MSTKETLCILGNGSHWSGLLEFEGTARIDSDFHGDIRTRGQLIVGPDAQIRGTLIVGELDSYGCIEGEVQAERKVILRSGSELQGNLNTRQLETEDGSAFNGRIHMLKNSNNNQTRRALLARHAEPLPDSTTTGCLVKNA